MGTITEQILAGELFTVKGDRILHTGCSDRARKYRKIAEHNQRIAFDPHWQEETRREAATKSAHYFQLAAAIERERLLAGKMATEWGSRAIEKIRLSRDRGKKNEFMAEAFSEDARACAELAARYAQIHIGIKEPELQKCPGCGNYQRSANWSENHFRCYDCAYGKVEEN